MHAVISRAAHQAVHLLDVIITNLSNSERRESFDPELGDVINASRDLLLVVSPSTN